jgi:hypothetical protein
MKKPRSKSASDQLISDAAQGMHRLRDACRVIAKSGKPPSTGHSQQATDKLRRQSERRP